MRRRIGNGVGKPQDLNGNRRFRPMGNVYCNNLVRLCREPLRGWLTTTRFVTNNIWTRYGTDEFLGSEMGQGQSAKL